MLASSSWIRLLRTASPGIAMKISESQVSSISLKALCLLAAASTAVLSDARCWQRSASMTWLYARAHAFSRSPITSANSWLLRSMGSTTSMFSEYLPINFLKTCSVLLTCSASFLTAALYPVQKRSSHLARVSALKSLRPFPLTLVTGLISLIFATISLYSSCLSPAVSPLSMACKLFSRLMACTTKRRASFSMTMSSKT